MFLEGIRTKIKEGAHKRISSFLLNNKEAVITAVERMYKIKGEENIREAVGLFKQTPNALLVVYSGKKEHNTIADNPGIGYVAALALELAKFIEGSPLYRFIFPATMQLESGAKGEIVRVLRKIMGEGLERLGVYPKNVIRRQDVGLMPNDSQLEENTAADLLNSWLESRGLVIQPSGGTEIKEYRPRHLIHYGLERLPDCKIIALPTIFDNTEKILKYNEKRKVKFPGRMFADIVISRVGIRTNPIATITAMKPFILNDELPVYDKTRENDEEYKREWSEQVNEVLDRHSQRVRTTTP